MATKKKKLTDKQKMFCKEYLIDFNGTQAAIRAGYSKKTANRIATENLSKPVIAEYVRQQKEKRNARVENLQDFVLKGLQENHARAQEIDNISASNRSLELLGKHEGMFSDKVKHEHTGKDGGAIETKSTIGLDIATLKALAHGNNE